MEGASQVGNPGTARPEVCAGVPGCPSRARHDMSWVPGRQSVLWPAIKRVFGRDRRDKMSWVTKS